MTNTIKISSIHPHYSFPARDAAIVQETRWTTQSGFPAVTLHIQVPDVPSNVGPRAEDLLVEIYTHGYSIGSWPVGPMWHSAFSSHQVNAAWHISDSERNRILNAERKDVTLYEAREISYRRCAHLMGALGLMGGTLYHDLDRYVVVQPAGSDIADGPLVTVTAKGLENLVKFDSLSPAVAEEIISKLGIDDAERKDVTL
jgi:hypothetical protein